jgi:hypothetical protein
VVLLSFILFTGYSIFDLFRSKPNGYYLPKESTVSSDFSISGGDPSKCREVHLGSSNDFYIDPDGLCAPCSDSFSGSITRPWCSISHAVEMIPFIKQSGDLSKPFYFYLRQGKHIQTQTVNFTVQDSGTSSSPIVFSSYPGENATITSEKKITSSWSRYSGNIYVTNIPEVVSKPWQFHTLFVNGKQAIRARTPNEGNYYRVKDFVWEDTAKTIASNHSFLFNPGEFRSSWRNLKDVEVVAFIVWENPRLQIESLDESKLIVNFSSQASSPFNRYWSSNKDKYYIENVFEGLDSPGEWYLDTHTGGLYYWPRAGEDLNTANVTAPTLETLIDFKGDIAKLSLPSSFSVTSWVKTASKDTDYILGNTGNYNGYRVWLYRGFISILIGNESGGTVKYNCGNKAINDDLWHHVAVVFDRVSKKVKCYTDGVKSEYGLLGDYPTMQQIVPQIGRVPGQWADLSFFNGSLDELMMFNRSLSEEEVQSIYLSNNPPIDSLVVRLPFNGDVTSSSPKKEIRPYLFGKAKYVSGKFGQAILFNDTSLDKKGRLIEVYSDEGLIKNVQFTNLTFSISDWNDLSRGYQGLVHFSDQSALRLNGVTNISFIGNGFFNLGGAYALYIGGKYFSFFNNNMSSLSGGGIFTSHYSSPWAERSSEIAFNSFSNTGKVYKDSVGIMIFSSANNSIHHNRVFSMPGMGISVGFFFDVKKTTVHDNEIAYNNVHNICEEVEDCGGIYTLGQQDGTRIHHNVVHDIVSTKHHIFPEVSIHAFYLDQASTNMLVDHNLMYNTNGSQFNLHNAFFNNIVQNIFVDAAPIFFADHPQNNVNLVNETFDGYLDPYGNIFEKNIFYMGKDLSTSFIYSLTPIYSWQPQKPSISISDRNLFFSKYRSLADDKNFTDWTRRGFEQHSLIADPLFVDYEHWDFRLKDNSPAFSLGFEQADFSSVPGFSWQLHSCSEGDWSSALSPIDCPASGVQTKIWDKIRRCEGGISHPEQEVVSCSPGVPTCTAFTYSDWGECSTSGVQTRDVLSRAPEGCQGGNPLTSSTCTPETCTPGQTLECDTVTHAVVSGYKDKCKEDGSGWLSAYSCSFICDSGYHRNFDRCEQDVSSYRSLFNSQDLNAVEQSGNLVLSDSYENNPFVKIYGATKGDLSPSARILRSTQSEPKEYILTDRLPVLKKTIYLIKKSSSSNGVCIANADRIFDIPSLLKNCTLLACPGQNEKYACAVSQNVFMVEGFINSGLIEATLFCGDGSCDMRESCSSCPSDCSVCSDTGSQSSDDDSTKTFPASALILALAAIAGCVLVVLFYQMFKRKDSFVSTNVPRQWPLSPKQGW